MVEEKYKYHNLSSDIVFKYIFGYDKNKCYTEWLLENIFNLERNSLKDKLKIKNSLDLNRTKFDSRGLELDVVVMMPNGDLINLEMYAHGFGEEEQEKSYIYLTTLFGIQLPPKVKYVKAKKCIQINFVKDKKYLDGHYRLLDKLKEYSSKGIELYVINIDRSEKSCYHINEELRLIYKLMNTKSLEEAKEIVKGNEVLENMAKDIEKFNKDEWLTDYFSVGSDWERKLNATAELKLQEGIEQGLIQGVNQKALETAKNMLKLKNISVEDIANVTGLSLKEIENLTIV